MADVVDSQKSLSHIDTAAAETVPLRASRKDVGMALKRRLNSLGEGTLKSEGTLDFIVVLLVVGSASSIIAAHTRAVILRTVTDARSIAVARLVAGLAHAHVKELIVRKRLRDDVANHAVNTETDLALGLENGVVLLSGLTLVVALGKTIRNEELRNSGLILRSIEATLVGSTNGLLVLHEAKEGKVLEAKVTILARSGGRLSSGVVVRILKHGAEVSIHAMSIDGRDPTMRPAGSDIGTELGILKASIRRSRSRSRGSNVDVLGELLLVPHRARVAGRHEEDEVLEHLLGFHSLKNLSEVGIMEELISGHGDDARVAVIVVEDENIILFGGLEDLAAAASGGDAHKSVLEVLQVSILGNVILDDTLINIDVLTTLNIELVVDLAGEGVLSIVGDIILEESDDALVRDASLVSKLVSLAHGRLVTIVAPASGTGDKHNPGLATVSLAGLNSLLEKLVLLVREHNREKSKCDQKSPHYHNTNKIPFISQPHSPKNVISFSQKPVFS